MITVYSMEGCASCVRAVQLLERKGIAHNVVKIDEDPAAYAFLKSKGTARSMPQIYEGENLYVEGGYQGLVTKLGN